MAKRKRSDYAMVVNMNVVVVVWNVVVVVKMNVSKKLILISKSISHSSCTLIIPLNLMGWRKVQTKYCQIFRPVNRLKRFIFACLVKRFGENFDDAIVIDECTVELRIFNPTNWRKDGQPLLRASGGKLGKPKHNVKVHLFGGISRKGLLPLITFGGIMYSKDYQNWLSLSVIPFIRQKFPFGHRFYTVTCTQKKLNFKFECEFGIPHSNSHLKTPKIPITHSIPHSESSISLYKKAIFCIFRIELSYID